MTPTRLLLSVLAGASAGVSAPVAAQIAGPTEVVIARPTTLTKTEDLDFGTVIAGVAAGEVVIDAGDDGGPAPSPRTVGGGVVAAGGSPHAASFLTFGSRGSQVTIELDRTDATLTRVGGTDTLAVVDLNINGAGKPKGRGKVTYKVGASGFIDFRVGGRLLVGSGQPPGDYRGRFTVTAIYK